MTATAASTPHSELTSGLTENTYGTSMRVHRMILQGKKRERGARYNMWRLSCGRRYETTFCGRGMVSRLPGNMCERTMRCNVTPERHSSERGWKGTPEEMIQRERRRALEVWQASAVRCNSANWRLKFSKMAAVRRFFFLRFFWGFEN